MESCALADRLCWLSICRMTAVFRLVWVKQITVMLLWVRCRYRHNITNPALTFDIAISCCLLVSVLLAIFAFFSLAVAASSASALLSSQRYPLSPCSALPFISTNTISAVIILGIQAAYLPALCLITVLITNCLKKLFWVFFLKNSMPHSLMCSLNEVNH